ncbi:10298_t:CDS:2 [Scutellospora calospora]|uniref:10298_t:CDS:1 n=1 Tax=Scutellospora calospora TaxID=85575 RepID=A0ACA9KNM8_9GLOM|nr:10298_t:CDS:2 [Scutellospora calospora]
MDTNGINLLDINEYFDKVYAFIDYENTIPQQHFKFIQSWIHNDNSINKLKKTHLINSLDDRNIDLDKIIQDAKLNATSHDLIFE